MRTNFHNDDTDYTDNSEAIIYLSKLSYMYSVHLIYLKIERQKACYLFVWALPKNI